MGLQLEIIFIINESANYFLQQLISLAAMRTQRGKVLHTLQISTGKETKRILTKELGSDLYMCFKNSLKPSTVTLKSRMYKAKTVECFLCID